MIRACAKCDEPCVYVDCDRCDGLGSRDDEGIDDAPCHYCESLGGWWGYDCDCDEPQPAATSRRAPSADQEGRKP